MSDWRRDFIRKAAAIVTRADLHLGTLFPQGRGEVLDIPEGFGTYSKHIRIDEVFLVSRRCGGNDDARACVDSQSKAGLDAVTGVVETAADGGLVLAAVAVAVKP